jgi:hypothetical protein
MFGFGMSEVLIATAAIVVFFAIGRMAFGRGTHSFAGPTLVLTRFEVNESGADDTYIWIEGRPSGLIGIISSIMGSGTITRLRLTSAELTVRTEGMSGAFLQSTLLKNVSSLHCGYSKSIVLLISAIIVIILGFVQIMMFSKYYGGRVPILNYAPFFVAGLILLFLYQLSKRMFLALETRGGLMIGVRFKPSIILGENIDFGKAEAAFGMIDRMVKARD